MECLISFRTKVAALALAALAVTGAIASTTPSAQAEGLSWGIGAGFVGAALVGSAIAASDGYHYRGDRRCDGVRQFGAHGNYTGDMCTCNY